jgi:hypothetical protein
MSTVNPAEAVVDTVTEREEPPTTRRTGLGEICAEKSWPAAVCGARVTSAMAASAARVGRKAVQGRLKTGSKGICPSLRTGLRAS